MPPVTLLSRSLLHSAFWSLSGTVVPMLAALAAVPWLMHTLGQERLGILSLVWVVVGYFSFLDMGLGRAVTVAVAALRANSAATVHTDEAHVLGTASVLLSGIGVVAAVILGLALWFWGLPFELSAASLRDEVALALLWTLPSLPLLLLSSALRGQLEGVGAFKALNLLRIPTGVMLVLGPCLSAAWTPSLVGACVSILVVRWVHVLVLWHLVSAQAGVGGIAFGHVLLHGVNRSWLRRLLSFGGWVTISNVIGPLIVYVDRFVIGFTLSAAAVAAYAIPFDLVSRLPILIAALCSVLLPELARLGSLAASTDPGAASRARQLVARSSALSLLVVVLVVALAYLGTPWAFQVWLGADFADQATAPTRVLLFAFGVNALAQIPFTALQAVGRVRQVALLHSIELLPYAVLVFLTISGFGLIGAAWAWLFRSIVDYIALAWMWHRHRGTAATSDRI
jgi:O-antigen/teichoic acid export membrane protein